MALWDMAGRIASIFVRRSILGMKPDLVYALPKMLHPFMLQ